MIIRVLINSTVRPNPNGHREVGRGMVACVRRIIRAEDACALPRGVRVSPLLARVSKRTRAIGERVALDRAGICRRAPI